MKTLFSVGFEIPGEGAKYVPFDSELSLLDADVVVFKPNMSSMYGYHYEYYQGKPSLSENASFELKERLEHWRRELNVALASGKAVIVFLTDLQEVFVDSGQRQYSGTGRNARVTRLVSLCSNYDCLPGNLSFTTCTGQTMRLGDQAIIFAEYWRLFGDRSTYKVTIDGKVSKRLVVSKDGSQVLGAIIQWKDMPGTAIFLPDTDFEGEGLIEEKSGELHWTKKARALGSQFVNCILEIDRVIRSQREITPVPNWAKARELDLPRERELKAELLKAEDEIRHLTNKKLTLQQEIREESHLKNLLYEKGKPLENAIVKALTILGFCSNTYRESDSEFDVVFEAAEGRLIGEAEGKDNKAINIDKLRQLEMNIHEDFARDSVDSMAKGVLFGNAYRLYPLTERGDFFTEKCLLAAKRSGCALVRTTDLFLVAQYLSGNPNAEFAKLCREAIVLTSGEIVSFPPIPAPEKGEELTQGGAE